MQSEAFLGIDNERMRFPNTGENVYYRFCFWSPHFRIMGFREKIVKFPRTCSKSCSRKTVKPNLYCCTFWHWAIAAMSVHCSNRLHYTQYSCIPDTQNVEFDRVFEIARVRLVLMTALKSNSILLSVLWIKTELWKLAIRNKIARAFLFRWDWTENDVSWDKLIMQLLISLDLPNKPWNEFLRSIVFSV